MKNISYIDDWTSWLEGFEFYQPVTVRFSETDMFGHLNNTVPFIYFEQARIAFLHEKGFMADWAEKGAKSIPVVADLQCDYLKQVFFNEKLRIYVKVGRVGSSSVDIHYLGRNEAGDICFTGRGTMVQILLETGKGLAWTEEERERLLGSGHALSPRHRK
nr:thioesterase family protein [Heyndrickxia acidiproducens]